MNSNERLGVDIGRVIIDGTHHPDGGDTAFFTGDTARLLRTPPMADVFEVLPRLAASFGGRVWLVSKCGERVEQRTRLWLAHHEFADRTGIAEDHVRFCRRRPDKAVHCAELGITHFVDDRPDVHEALAGVVGHRFLFGPQAQPSPPGVVATLTWSDAERAITATRKEDRTATRGATTGAEGPPPAAVPPARSARSVRR
jgi:hypothetical protein